MQAMNEGGFFWRCFCAVSPRQQDSTSIYSSKLLFWCILLLWLKALMGVARWVVGQARSSEETLSVAGVFPQRFALNSLSSLNN